MKAHRINAENDGTGRLAQSVFGETFLTRILAVSVVFLAMLSTSFAAGHGGVYGLWCPGGKITIGNVTSSLAPRFVSTVRIKNNRVMLDREAARRYVNSLTQFIWHSPAQTSVSGPSNLKLDSWGNFGSTTTPLVFKISTTYNGEPISGTIKANVKAVIYTIGGKKLTLALTAPFSGKVGDKKISGELSMRFVRN